MNLVPGQDCTVTTHAHADEAEANTGPRRFDGRPTHPPTGVIACAELRFIRGVALAELNENDSEALTEALGLIESAVGVVGDLGDFMDEPWSSRFLARFAQWRRVADLIRGKEHDAPK